MAANVLEGVVVVGVCSASLIECGILSDMAQVA